MAELARRLTYRAYLAAASASKHAPEPLAAGAARVAGLAYAWAMPRRRAVVAEHLRLLSGDSALPPRRVEEVFVSYARYWVESFRLDASTLGALGAKMTCAGLGHLDAALSKGKGAILGLPHLGNWDLGGAWLASRGYPAMAAVEPLRPAELFEWFTNRRRALGVEVVPAGPEAPPALLAGLRQNAVVGLVSDRDLSGRGIAVSFFGKQTTMPAGPAVLSLRSGAPILPAAVYSPSFGRHHALIRPPLARPEGGSIATRVREITAALAKELESLIRAAPEQWHVLQPLWPSDPRR